MNKWKSAVSAALGTGLISTAALALQASEFSGKPAQFQAGAVRGAAVWQDGGQLKIRFTSNDGTRTFAGKVCSPGGIQGFRPHQLEKVDSAAVGPKGKCVLFKFQTMANIDGFDFDAPEQVVFFDFKEGLKPLAKEHIWVGAAGVHPEHSPFTRAPAQPRPKTN